MTISINDLSEGFQRMNLTDSEYRSLEATSYSDLLEFERYEAGSYSRLYNMASKVGEQFHRLVLNPDQKLPNNGIAAPAEMFRSLIKAPFFKKYFNESQKDVTYLNISKCGLVIKGRVDLVHFDTAIDLVSTKASSPEEFVQLFEKLNYHRKASFYLSLTELKNFLYIGVQRSYPYNVYTIQCSERDGVTGTLMDQANEKNNLSIEKLKIFLSNKLQSA